MALQVGSGKYFQDTLNGNVFIGTTAAAGVVLPIFSSTTAPVSVLWNPLGSGKNIWLISCQIGYVSGTGTAGNFAYGTQSGTGATAATGSPVLTFTAVTPQNAIIGGGNASVMKYAPAVCTLTTGCTLLKTMSVSQTAVAAAGAAVFSVREDFDGTLMIPPGALFTVGANVASAITADVTLIWEEI